MNHLARAASRRCKPQAESHVGQPAEAFAALNALRETPRGDSRMMTRWVWEAIREGRYDLGDERARFEELLEPRGR